MTRIILAVIACIIPMVMLFARNSEIDIVPYIDTAESSDASESSRGPMNIHYTNKRYRFSLEYPADLAVTEYDEAGSAQSIVFENSDDSRGFQIYITPYAAGEITRERFLLDAPSGVMREPIDVIVDGSRATIFFGENPIMGETREVWFIYDGFLYEVVTFKKLDAWLADIIATWRFSAQ